MREEEEEEEKIHSHIQSDLYFKWNFNVGRYSPISSSASSVNSVMVFTSSQFIFGYSLVFRFATRQTFEQWISCYDCVQVIKLFDSLWWIRSHYVAIYFIDEIRTEKKKSRKKYKTLGSSTVYSWMWLWRWKLKCERMAKSVDEGNEFSRRLGLMRKHRF